MGFASGPEPRARRSPQRGPGTRASAAELCCSRGRAGLGHGAGQRGKGAGTSFSPAWGSGGMFLTASSSIGPRSGNGKSMGKPVCVGFDVPAPQVEKSAPLSASGARSPLLTKLPQPSRLPGVPRLRDRPWALSPLRGSRLPPRLCRRCPEPRSPPPRRSRAIATWDPPRSLQGHFGLAFGLLPDPNMPCPAKKNPPGAPRDGFGARSPPLPPAHLRLLGGAAGAGAGGAAAEQGCAWVIKRYSCCCRSSCSCCSSSSCVPPLSPAPALLPARPGPGPTPKGSRALP